MNHLNEYPAEYWRAQFIRQYEARLAEELNNDARNFLYQNLIALTNETPTTIPVPPYKIIAGTEKRNCQFL